MTDFYLYDFKNFNKFENNFLSVNKNKDLVLLCIGTNNYFYDSFGVKIGDKLKKLKIFVYGGSKREINGLNYLNVYKFIRKKHRFSKILIIDSVYSKSIKKPILIYKESPINVSCLNTKLKIGNAGILFNSFAFSFCTNLVVNKVENMFKKFINSKNKQLLF